VSENEVIKLHARPRPPLDRFVECFWFYRGYARAHDREIVLPTGSSSIVFKLTDTPVRSFRDTGDTVGQTFGGAVASGAFASHFVLDTSQTSSTLGVQFKPGSASAFFGVPAGELSGTRVSLEELWGPKALSLRDQILEAATPETAIARVERALIARLRRPLLMHPAVAHALARIDAEPAIARIAEIRHETGYGAKRFIELFRASVGLAPKTFSRVRRFQSVIDRLADGRRVEWAAVAADGGYSDQPHLNREFRRMAGVTPCAYRPVEPGHRNHVAVDGEKFVQDASRGRA
jgi:AraC-like DNA-binding protein